MFSKACEYGIRAMIYLTAASKEGSNMSIRDICRETGAPEHFTAKILQNLSRKGLVSSRQRTKGDILMDDDHVKTKPQPLDIGKVEQRKRGSQCVCNSWVAVTIRHTTANNIKER